MVLSVPAVASELRPFSAEDVIFYLPFDEEQSGYFTDPSGQFDGEIVGSTDQIVASVIRGGVTFDSTGTYSHTGHVQMASPAELFGSSSGGSFTVSTIVTISDENNIGGVYSFGTVTPVDVRLDVPNGGLQMRFYGVGHQGPRIAQLIPANEIEEGVPYHLVLVWDIPNLETRGYVDGELVATLSFQSTVDYFSENIDMAISAIEYSGSYQSTFNGVVDEFVMLNRPLTDAEVSEVHDFYRNHDCCIINSRNIADLQVVVESLLE